MKFRACLLVAVASVAACSFSWEYTYDVTISPEVELPEGARIVMASSETSDDIAEAMPDADEETIDADRTHTGSGRTCCSPNVDVYLFAFVDLDGNLVWDEGEPWGEDPNNPVDIAEDGYVAKITVDAVAE